MHGLPQRGCGVIQMPTGFELPRDIQGHWLLPNTETSKISIQMDFGNAASLRLRFAASRCSSTYHCKASSGRPFALVSREF